MARPVSKIDLTLEQRIELQKRGRAATTPQRESLRARIVLLRARGRKLEDVAQQVGISINSVCKWSSRFEALGIEGLEDAAARGRKPWLPGEKVEQVLTKSLSRRRDGGAGAYVPWRKRWESRMKACAASGGGTISNRI